MWHLLHERWRTAQVWLQLLTQKWKLQYPRRASVNLSISVVHMQQRSFNFSCRRYSIRQSLILALTAIGSKLNRILGVASRESYGRTNLVVPLISVYTVDVKWCLSLLWFGSTPSSDNTCCDILNRKTSCVASSTHLPQYGGARRQVPRPPTHISAERHKEVDC